MSNIRIDREVKDLRAEVDALKKEVADLKAKKPGPKPKEKAE